MSPAGHSRPRPGISGVIAVWNLPLLLFVLVACFALLEPNTFLTGFTFRSMATTRSINALIALAVMIPLAANAYDLSAASMLGFAQVLANGLQTQQGLSWPVACIACLALGAVVGVVNGGLVTRLRINSFIATLGSGTVLLGLNQWYTGGRQVVGPLPSAFTALAGRIAHTPIPAPFVYALAAAVCLWLVFEYLAVRPLAVCDRRQSARRGTDRHSGATVRDDCFCGVGRVVGAGRHRAAGATSGGPEHGGAGADAAGLHRRAPRRNGHSPGAAECVGHHDGGRGAGRGGRRG